MLKKRRELTNNKSHCRNLATIADGLGMDQDVAGVTLLALGNGSPDVSTGRKGGEASTS